MKTDTEITAYEKTKLKEHLSKTYNCGTCKFSYFDSKDQNESEKCSLIGKFNTVPRDRKLEKFIAIYDLTSVCDSWQQKEIK